MLPLYACDTNRRNAEEGGDTPADTTATRQQQGSALEAFGIQLWTVKEHMAKDPRETLRQLASYGYTQIESFEGQQGMFWGMSNREFKSYMDELNMALVASHCNVKEGLEAKAAQAAEIGMAYLIDPYEGAQKSLDDYRRMADRFNQYGEICRKNGLRFAYHNHEYTFVEQEGQIPQNILLENTDPALVDFELDMYWIGVGGMDAAQHLQEHKGRYKLGHVKDRLRDAAPDEKNASTELGTGSVNYSSLLAQAKASGMEYFFVEQERFDAGTSLQSSEKNAAFMKSLRI
ncbi:Inosose dehydratase [Cesiribacter andamanensis AMV16]|uniref:Inosose dehydratase n=2 Tax=Cesiribacter TaxID=1133570 RepID=M7N1T3_9BACT|nr:Inosose dehydratase [Cesiribacter andamanensis AMV16]